MLGADFRAVLAKDSVVEVTNQVHSRASVVVEPGTVAHH